MSFHSDYDNWARLTHREHCPVCQQGPMPDGMVDIAELPGSWLSVEPAVCLKGTCCVIAKQHVVELFELADEDLLTLMKDVARCAQALRQVAGAVRINYEIHGNTVPHLHVHLFPRYRDDPFPDQPIDYRQRDPAIYAPGEFAQFVAAMRQELTG